MAGTVFVTGGTGHTGARLVRRLLADGWRVRALARAGKNRQFLPAHERLEIIDGDLSLDAAPGPWVERLRGADAVIHVAHISFACAIVAACEQAEVRRLIAVSSTRRFTRFPDETARRVVEGESAIAASPLDFAILRPSMIYGGARDNNLEKIAAWLRRRRVFPLVRGGSNLVQPIFVDDLVEALACALARPGETARRSFTVAGPAPLTWKEMIATLASGLGVAPIWIPIPYALAFAGAAALEAKPGRPLATRDQVRRLLEDKTFDIGEAREALGGWWPRSFEEGIRLKLAGID